MYVNMYVFSPVVLRRRTAILGTCEAPTEEEEEETDSSNNNTMEGETSGTRGGERYIVLRVHMHACLCPIQERSTPVLLLLLLFLFFLLLYNVLFPCGNASS